jgi:hypothetical protein
VLDAGLEQSQRAQDIHVGVVGGVGDRTAYVELRRLVDQHLRALPREEVAHGSGIADIGLIEARPWVEIRALTGRQVVDDQRLMPGGDQGIDEVRTDETGSPGHENTHDSCSFLTPLAPPDAAPQLVIVADPSRRSLITVSQESPVTRRG